MTTFNKAILVGRATKDFELKATQSGKQLTRFTLAVTGYNDSTNFITCIAWGKTAEFLCNYCGKGDLILVEGEITTGSYEKQDGTKVFTTDISVSRVQALESKEVVQARRNHQPQVTSQQYATPQQQYANPYQPQQQQQYATPYQAQTHNDQNEQSTNISLTADDLPF